MAIGVDGLVAGHRLRLVALCAGAACLGQNTARAQDQKIKTVTVWVNAFIPKDIKVAGKPDLTKVVPGTGPHKGKTMIPGPVPGVSDCFLTDQRGFSSDPAAPSRMHCGVTVDVARLAISGTPDKRCDPTVEVDCGDGAEECSRAAPTNRIEVKEFSATAGGGGAATIKFRMVGAAGNACFVATPGMLVPDIDWDIPVTIAIGPGGEVAVITAKGDKAVESFPAFEMYVRTNSKPAVTVFQEMPVDGKTPASLFGGPDRGIDKSVTVGSLMNGVWGSTDADKRFRLTIADKSVTWVERRPTGASLSRTVTMAPDAAPNTFRLSRPNDDEVLKFLDFPDAALRTQIVGAGPEASFLVLTRDGDKLVGTWHGLLVRKLPNGKLKEIVQPSAITAKVFEFKR